MGQNLQVSKLQRLKLKETRVEIRTEIIVELWLVSVRYNFDACHRKMISRLDLWNYENFGSI
jgi:hypothetical protein